jgi:hypothetical protein
MLNQSYPFVQTKTLRQHFELGKFAEARLRSQLPSPIYWIQPERKILWNLVLVKDWLINGAGESHNRMIEDYLSSLLPSHQRKLPKVSLKMGYIKNTNYRIKIGVQMTSRKLSKLEKAIIIGVLTLGLPMTFITLNTLIGYSPKTIPINVEDYRFNPDKGIDIDLVEYKSYRDEVIKKCNDLLIDKKEGKITPEYFYHACS